MRLRSLRPLGPLGPLGPLRPLLVAALGLVSVAAGCGEPTLEEKCIEVCDETLGRCTDIACSESCGGRSELGSDCAPELERYYDCTLEIIDDLSDDELDAMCHGSPQAQEDAAKRFGRCDEARKAWLACEESSGQ